MTKQPAKPRIALFGVGTLGGGHLWQGVPAQNELFETLSLYYEIVFYSFSRVKTTHIPPKISVRQIISMRIPGRVKYFLLFLRALADHVSSPYSLLFSVSVYPSGYFAIKLGKLLKKPVLIQLIATEAAAIWDIRCGNLVSPWLRKITEGVCKNADALVCVAEYQKKIAIESLPATREIVVLPLRINSKKFPFRERRISVPVEFIQIADYSRIKDQRTLFAAFAKVAERIDCHLTVIGGGFDVQEVHTLLEHFKIRNKVTFAGVVSQSNLAEYLEDAHVLLHTARFETGCAAIQEAMASGVAVCGTEVGILADIGDRYAVTVPPLNAAQLAEKIIQLIGDPAWYRAITCEAHEWISEFDAAWAAKNYLNFIEQMLLGNGKNTRTS